MKIEQKKWTKTGNWTTVTNNNLKDLAQWVLVFGGRDVVKDPEKYAEIQAWYPSAQIIMCSTAGEILHNEVLDDSLVVTAVMFEKTQIVCKQTHIADAGESESAGANLAAQLDPVHLQHAMVFAEGNKINGTTLVKGITDRLPKTVSVTGGLVGDGARFQETVVGLNGIPVSGNIVLIGFYGENLKLGYGSLGGWDVFGPERLITKSDGHILYEVDGENALELYKKYLGEKAKELPASGLLFPLSLTLKTDQGDVEVVRTLLSIDETNKSMTFAGDIPTGTYAKLMKANFERLIDGAGGAANMSIEQLGTGRPELAILISCIGRKLVLGARIEEEIDSVRTVVGPEAAITGFYSYGEICPTTATSKQCQLHNQTMTITTFREQ